jgi:hypothetical protein
VFAVCVGKPGSGAGRKIKNMPKKTMGCLVMELKKNRKSTASGISEAVGFYSPFNWF